MTEYEPNIEYFTNAELDDLTTKIRVLLEREQPCYELVVYAFVNVTIGIALQSLGMKEEALRGFFSTMLDEYLLRMRAS